MDKIAHITVGNKYRDKIICTVVSTIIPSAKKKKINKTFLDLGTLYIYIA